MYDGRILDKDKMKLVKKAIPWALREDTRGGMFTVASDGIFSQEAVLAHEGAGNSFTPSPNTKRKSPRGTATCAANSGSTDGEAPGSGTQGRPTKRQQAKANRQACTVSGNTLEEWRKDPALWPFPRWRL
jgi:hypothetical protein